MAMIIAMEQARNKGWLNVWLESDSLISLGAFKNHDIVPWDLRNRWSNCFSLGLNIHSSHIFREGNTCADKLANEGLALSTYTWWGLIPPCIRDEFLRDKLGLPNFRIH
ncbi:ribonuclease H protein [Trifolium medium]|uniref:Ribonuclease H protein n=1 Tax=Trifolium medium TaxID=97028 RepID=A0A392PI59_9FABA|nr:ribonuclease H protein [Trifolium medium]